MDGVRQLAELRVLEGTDQTVRRRAAQLTAQRRDSLCLHADCGSEQPWSEMLERATAAAREYGLWVPLIGLASRMDEAGRRRVASAG